MGLNDTPRADRLHIGIFGARNAGKSSLINALTGQDLAIVSDTPGTTADPVYKAMELHGIGPVVFIDTAGFDDEGELGQLRVAKTRDVIAHTDLAIVVVDGASAVARGYGGEQRKRTGQGPMNRTEPASMSEDPGDPFPLEHDWIRRFCAADIPVITVISKADAPGAANPAAAYFEAPITVSAKTGMGIDDLREAIRRTLPEEYMQSRILGELLEEGSLALLVMPQDIQAPKGRLILPQVQTIRELLDRKCAVMSTTADGLAEALAALNRAPDLIITDSQCFGEVYALKPPTSELTSFSILMAAAKGDISVFTEGAAAIDRALTEERPAKPFRVLIAEACTHVPMKEDIGTVKIPQLLRKTFGSRVHITSVRGGDFPQTEDLKQYDLIIHCGACMFNRRHVMSRITAAQAAGVPITNYGIFLAKMAGILDKVSLGQPRHL